jgi:protein-S-isoprenylcysteine O-methyltransferase Ste14
MLGSRVVVWLAIPALLVIVLRIAREEQALARVFPDYQRYAALTRRVVPFLF